MPDPARALLWFLAAVTAIGIFAWPRFGLSARLVGGRRMRDRVRIEDALKHILNGELGDRLASVASIAGVLEISRGRAHELIARLSELGLTHSDERGISLSPEGRTYAFRILRTHRLLERYFADRTGVAASEWHDRAEMEEHALDARQVEELSVRMGHPVYDPHGDPIPTAAGRLPPRQGAPVTSLAPGETGAIIHVEDEPVEVYRRLLALGVNPTVPVKMVAVGGNAVDVLVAGRLVRLDPLMAAAVTVARVAEVAGHTASFDQLDGLAAGESAEVVDISPAVQGPQRRRLLDLGVLPGTIIGAEMRSPSGDPVAYRIRGALIALRRKQAEAIYVKKVAAGHGVSA